MYAAFRVWGEARILESESGLVWAFTVGFFAVLVPTLYLIRPTASFVPEQSPEQAAVERAQWETPSRPWLLLLGIGSLVAAGGYLWYDLSTWEQAGGERHMRGAEMWLYYLFGKWGPPLIFWVPALGVAYHWVRVSRRTTKE